MASLPTRVDLLRIRIVAFTRAARRARRGEVRGVHRTRVAVRRLRELLPILPLGPERSRQVGRALRRVSRGLSPVREADVLAALLAQLLSRRGGPAGHAGLEALVEIARRATEKVRRRALDAELRHRLERLTRRLRKTLRELQRTDPGPRRRWRVALEARVARRARTLRDAIESAGTMYAPEPLHEVRLATKKLRYALELLGEATATPLSPELKRLRDAQRTLGQIHDAQLALEFIRRQHADDHVVPLSDWRGQDAWGSRLERECRRLHARYLRGRAATIAICDRWAGRMAPAARRVGETRPDEETTWLTGTKSI